MKTVFVELKPWYYNGLNLPAKHTVGISMYDGYAHFVLYSLCTLAGTSIPSSGRARPPRIHRAGCQPPSSRRCVQRQRATQTARHISYRRAEWTRNSSVATRAMDRKLDATVNIEKSGSAAR